MTACLIARFGESPSNIAHIRLVKILTAKASSAAVPSQLFGKERPKQICIVAFQIFIDVDSAWPRHQ